MKKFDKEIRARAAQEMKDLEVPAELKNDIDRILERLPERAEETVPSAARWGFRRPALAGVFAVAVLALMPVLMNHRNEAAASMASRALSSDVQLTDNAEYVIDRAAAAEEMYREETGYEGELLTEVYADTDQWTSVSVCEASGDHRICYNLTDTDHNLSIDEVLSAGYQKMNGFPNVSADTVNPVQYMFSCNGNLMIINGDIIAEFSPEEYGEYINKDFRHCFEWLSD